MECEKSKKASLILKAKSPEGARLVRIIGKGWGFADASS
jgi:hypothetical protein